MSKVVIIILLLLVLGGGLFYFQSQKKTAIAPTTAQPTVTTAPTMQPTEGTSSSGAMKMEGAMKEFTVEGKNFSFTPSTLTVNKGDMVKVTFKDTEGGHDFVIDDYSVHTKMLQAGQSETVSFKADKTGTFEYYCSVGNHRQMGMKGSLTVK